MNLPLPNLPVSTEKLPFVLLVEDSPPLAHLYQNHLKDERIRLAAADTGAKALQILEQEAPDLVLLDLDLPDMNGLEILRAARHLGYSSSFVVITANGSIQNAVEAMQAGASDFIVKPFTKDRLKVTVANALEKQRLTQIVEHYREESEKAGLDRMIGASPAMQGVYRIVESAAPSRATVFILGESGTGKELCAEAIHRLSPRAGKPFVAINCAAIPRELMESEIFGHVEGAFTGATRDREGAAARANGGTLFLDEICEMDVELQSKLLRFIQTQTYQRVGGTRLERADIRFVCATNRDPLAEVRAGRFREDLYYRLHVIPPPPARCAGMIRASPAWAGCCAN
jgi:DNA-binding NtrC family response regulator